MLGVRMNARDNCLCARWAPRSPAHRRQFAETLAKRIRRDVAKARAKGGLSSDFIFGAQRQAAQA